MAKLIAPVLVLLALSVTGVQARNTIRTVTPGPGWSSHRLSSPRFTSHTHMNGHVTLGTGKKGWK